MAKTGKKKAKGRKPGRLTAILKAFCREYVKCRVGQTAVEKSGSKARGDSAASLASKWLIKDKVKAEIDRLEQELEKRGLKTAEDWEREIDLIAFFRGHKDFYKIDGTLKDIKNLTSEQLALVHEIEHSSIGGGKDSKPLVRITNLKLHDKLKALDMKGKRLGIYKQTFVFEDPYMKYLEEIRRQKKQEKP